MFIGEKSQNQTRKGIRVSGFQARKDQEFSLGWQTSNHLNKQQQAKRKEVTGKVTSNTNATNQKPTEYLEKPTASPLQLQYQRIIRENPNISEEELDRLLLKFTKSEQARIQSSNSVRTQPKVRQSSNNIIYGGNEVEQQNNPKVTSKRNTSSLVLGDGYNYFKENKK